MTKVKILLEEIDPSAIDSSTLTNDCMFVYLENGRVDMVRAKAMVHVFDTFHDAGFKVKAITHCGGSRNPKFQEPEF